MSPQAAPLEILPSTPSVAKSDRSVDFMPPPGPDHCRMGPRATLSVPGIPKATCVRAICQRRRRCWLRRALAESREVFPPQVKLGIVMHCPVEREYYDVHYDSEPDVGD